MNNDSCDNYAKAAKEAITDIRNLHLQVVERCNDSIQALDGVLQKEDIENGD